MGRNGAFGGSAVLWALLAAHVAMAFEPVSVGIAIGAVSLTGYLSYSDWYCRFTECCREDRPLNASGRCLRGAGGRAGGDPLGRSRHTCAGLAMAAGELKAAGTAVRPVGRAPPSRKPAFGSCIFSEPAGVAGKLAWSSAARWLFPGWKNPSSFLVGHCHLGV